jgi:glutaredoxin 3
MIREITRKMDLLQKGFNINHLLSTIVVKNYLSMYTRFYSRFNKVLLLLFITIMVSGMINPSSLTLYIKPGCPYCAKVTNFMEQNDITIKTKNVAEPKIRDELIEIGGKKQVPCLVHNKTALYESSDIIEWMKKNLLNQG